MWAPLGKLCSPLTPRCSLRMLSNLGWPCVSCRLSQCRQMHHSSQRRRRDCWRSCLTRQRSPLPRRQSGQKRHRRLRSAERLHRKSRLQRSLWRSGLRDACDDHCNNNRTTGEEHQTVSGNCVSFSAMEKTRGWVSKWQVLPSSVVEARVRCVMLHA